MTPGAVRRLRLQVGAAGGPWFAWAGLAVDDLPQVASSAGLTCVESWEAAGRSFARLDHASADR
ncbi:MAG: hypothetical protein H0U92_13045 [Actinobacteria bacterium]|nr:hypothetical protein [Actinomycetota bacterium]